MSEPRKSTSTSSFGVGKREAHDASEFYARFTPPEFIDEEDLAEPFELSDSFVCGDSRLMTELPDNSVALVVTSPPYFAGKQYELDVERAEIPASYGEYLGLLSEVFAECMRVLEPGGRIAVNVANLGRKPYRSLSADVIRILQDDLRFLLRGEVIWKKADGAAGSCAWGTFKKATNPVLRDLSERVIIASKGRFDRARTVEQRRVDGLPHESTIANDEFMEATLDVWEIDAESAKRVGHPAPFPVTLPERLIGLYTYRSDLVLDPFMGSGSTLVAAARTGRRYVGYDLDPAFVEIARDRVTHVQAAVARRTDEIDSSKRESVSTRLDRLDFQDLDFQARATQEGKAAQALAAQVLEKAGFTILARNYKPKGLGPTVNLHAVDGAGMEWFFDVSGAFTTTKRGGLRRTDTVWKSIGRASVLERNGKKPVVLLTSHLPKPGTEGHRALRSAGWNMIFDVIEMLNEDATERLAAYATGDCSDKPLPGFWTEADIEKP